jgi:hypothetical protein
VIKDILGNGILRSEIIFHSLKLFLHKNEYQGLEEHIFSGIDKYAKDI